MPNHPHPIDIAELRRLHEAATPGPWLTEIEAEPDDRDHGSDQPEVYLISEHTVCDATVVATMGTASSIPNRRKRDDAHLIAKMRNALPAILDRIEAERSAIVAYIRAEASRCYAAGTGCLADAVTAEGDALTAIAAEIEVGNHLPAAPTTGGANA